MVFTDMQHFGSVVDCSHPSSHRPLACVDRSYDGFVLVWPCGRLEVPCSGH